MCLNRLCRLPLVTVVFVLLKTTTGFIVYPFTFSHSTKSPFRLLISSSTQSTRATGNISPEFDIGVINIPGEDWKRPGKVNQDAWFLNETDDYVLIGVLDGHGTLGHDVSSYFASQLPSEIQHRLESSSERIPVTEFEERLKEVSDLPSFEDHLSLVLMDSFHAVHWNAMVDPDQKPGRSGATCIACLVDKNSKECYIAYVGDSKAICHNGKDIRVVAERTTVDMPDERKRIESAEGSIRGNNVFYGPVGIAMTRALGDSVMLRAGVIPTPFVETFKLQDCDTLVLATDGIWDVLQDEEVANIAGGKTCAQEMATSLATVAREKWAGDLPIMDEVKADDITVLVLTCKERQ